MKKVLLVTNTHSIFNEPFRKAFESLVVEVKEADYRGNAVLMSGKFIHRIVDKLPAIVKYLLFNLAQWHADFKILSNANSFKPDLIFVLKGKDIHRQILKKLRVIGKVANYYPETFDHWKRIKSIVSHYDYFFNYDPEIIKRLREMGHQNAFYLPFSADISKNEIFPDFNKKEYNVSFIGSFVPIRYAQRETILSQVKDLGLHIWGNKAWVDTGLKDYYHGRPETHEMLEIYRKSKMVVNIDLMTGVEGTGVNLRPFEVTSCGAMLLNHDERKDIFNLFKEGEEFISFKGPEDIREKVQYYLGHPDELESVAMAGFERTKHAHTYIERISEVLNIIAKSERANMYYIANHQLPTTKAHGLQIMKMCEAFSECGIDCELIIPKRSIDPDIKELDPFKFYGVKNIFRITRLKSFDFTKWGNSWLGKPLFWIQQLSFGCLVKRYLKNKNGVIYSRDQFSLQMLLNTNFKLFWEAHNFPKNINSQFYKNIFDRINGLIVISDGLKNQFSKFCKKNIFLAPDAVDIDEFDIDISMEDARAEVGLPLDKKIAMYVGHLYKWKGVNTLTRASKFLASNELIVIIGGLKEDRDSLVADIPEEYKDKVKFIDYVSHDKVPIFLKSADCLVLTGKGSEAISRQYTSPLKLFEYMASKRPITAQDLPSFREILNSQNSILIEPDNSEALVEGLQLAFYDKNLSENIVRNAFNEVQKRTWANRAKNIYNYLNN